MTAHAHVFRVPAGTAVQLCLRCGAHTAMLPQPAGGTLAITCRPDDCEWGHASLSGGIRRWLGRDIDGVAHRKTCMPGGHAA